MVSFKIAKTCHNSLKHGSLYKFFVTNYAIIFKKCEGEFHSMLASWNKCHFKLALCDFVWHIVFVFPMLKCSLSLWDSACQDFHTGCATRHIQFILRTGHNACAIFGECQNTLKIYICNYIACVAKANWTAQCEVLNSSRVDAWRVQCEKACLGSRSTDVLFCCVSHVL